VSAWPTARSRDDAPAAEQVVVSSVKEKGKELALPKLGGGVPAKDLAIFTRQFSVMIDAGLPLVQCLEILGCQQENKTFAKVLQQTRMDVEGGASLADAMRKHPKAFDDLFTNMIAAGEAGGILDTILKRWPPTSRRRSSSRPGQGRDGVPDRGHQHRGIVIAVILWKVIPTFASMFAGLDAELPLPTRIVIAMSKWFVRLLPFIVIGGICGVVAFRRYYATYRRPARRRQGDPEGADLRPADAEDRGGALLPHALDADRLGRAILDGLEITARTAGNAIIEDAIMAVRKGVESGLTVASRSRRPASSRRWWCR
jgi:type IV pilus assembly protein PilC